MSVAFHVLGVDPGDKTHALVWCRVDPGTSFHPGLVVPEIARDNVSTSNALSFIIGDRPGDLAAPWAFGVERIATGYKAAGRELFDTQWIAGRMFERALRSRYIIGAESVFRSTAAAYVGKWESQGATGDAEVRNAIIGIYGGDRKAIGGRRCTTCKKPEGWIGKDHDPCPNCNAAGGGHGDLGYEDPRGPLWSPDSPRGWKGSHLYAALAVAMVTASRIAKGSAP